MQRIKERMHGYEAHALISLNMRVHIYTYVKKTERQLLERYLYLESCSPPSSTDNDRGL
jgi:hypothetical protein